MEFYEVLKKRRSIRGYRPDPVPEEVLQRISNAIYLAPSACNRQPFKVLFVRDAAIRKKICGACRFRFLDSAPMIAVMLTNESEAWVRPEGNPAADIDASIAMEHLVLSAAAEGLGTCWICAFERKAMNEVLEIQTPYSVFAISPLGYAAAEPVPFVRKNYNDIIETIG